TQALAAYEGLPDFQDATTFLRSGGQRGPQRAILREGTYAINLAQFVVITGDGVYCLPLQEAEIKLLTGMADLIEARHGFEPVVLKDKDDLMGIVTVH